jgi:hypothetical protein
MNYSNQDPNQTPDRPKEPLLQEDAPVEYPPVSEEPPPLPEKTPAWVVILRAVAFCVMCWAVLNIFWNGFNIDTVGWWILGGLVFWGLTDIVGKNKRTKKWY